VPAEVRNINSYLYRAIVNHILDSVRARENYRRAVKKYAKETRIPINKRLAGNVLIEDTEQRNATIASLARHLQEREAEAFVLRYRDNFSIGEIATRMGVNARTVSRYLSESLRRLRETLTT
jgi:RNA polymerase sigma factor (sigma-70 family)